MTNTPSAFRLPPADAGGIKPGTFVSFIADSFEGAESRRGVVLEVWATKEQKKLVAFHGFVLR